MCILKFAHFQIFKLISYPYTTHYIDLPGNCRVAYIDEGSGERTLLFIHGLANYAPVWKKNIDELKKYYRCVAIDLPGNGLSDQHAHPFGMKFFAECVFNFINALKLKDLHIVGHSMGGQIAMTTVLNHPGCAESLILCAPAGFEQFSVMEKTMYYTSIHLLDFISSDENSLRTAIQNSFYRNHTQGDGIVKELVGIMKTYKLNYYKKMVEACIKGMMEEPVFSKLNRLHMPVLVLFGKNDALIPNKLLHHTTTEKIAADAVSKMHGAHLVMIPHCGHFVQWEKAEDVNRNIILFLENEM